MLQLIGGVGLLAVSIFLPALPALGAGFPDPGFAGHVREFPAPHQASFHGIAAFRGMLFTISGLHVYRSADGGRNWAACATTGLGLPNLRLNQVDTSGSGLWMHAGHPGSGAFLHSDDGGMSWRNSLPENPEAAPHGLLYRGDTLIAYGGKLGDELGSIWYKPPHGGIWLPWGSPAGMNPVSATSFGPYIYAQFDSGNTRTVLRARGPGTDWEKADAGLPLGLGPDNTPAIPELWFGQRRGRLYAAVNIQGVYALDPDGRTWNKDSWGFGPGSPFFFQAGNGLGMIAWDSVFIRDDASGAWTNRGVIPGPRGDDESFAIRGDSLLVTGYKRVLVSVDEGASWRPMEIQTGLRESGDNSLVAAADWGGASFLHYTNRTFRTENAGRDWGAMDFFVKQNGDSTPPYIHPYTHLISTSRMIMLFYRGPNQFARYDAPSGIWKLEEFPPDSNFTFGIGADSASLVRHVQAYSNHAGGKIPHQLQRSVDGGGSWKILPAPDSVLSISNEFEKIQVDGNGILIFSDPPKGAAASLDGGMTWIKPPDSAAVLLDAGCFHWIDEGEQHSQCAGSTRTVPTPFRQARKMWGDGRGGLFAWADSILYVLAADARPPAWNALAGKTELRGWRMEGDVLSLHAEEKVRIFTPEKNAIASIADHPVSRPRAPLRPSTLSNGRMIWLDFDGRPRDARGKTR